MRNFTISVLSLFVVLPTVASARLPVVNIASGAVSARSAFGEDMVKATKKQAEPTRKKNVVARSAKKTVAPKSKVAKSPRASVKQVRKTQTRRK